MIATRLSSPKSRHEMPGSMLVGLCPGGTNDSSQAIYCLEQVQSRIRPVGHGLILTPGCLIVLIVARLSDPIIPCPTGRFPFLHGYQAINCLATIIQSLRDDPDERELVPTALSFERLGGPGRRGLRPRRRA